MRASECRRLMRHIRELARVYELAEYNFGAGFPGLAWDQFASGLWRFDRIRKLIRDSARKRREP